MFSVSEAANRLGISDRRVRALIVGGRLPAQRLGRAWAIEPSALLSVDGVRSPGRPLAAKRAWTELFGDERAPVPTGDLLRWRYRQRSSRLWLDGPDVAAAISDPVVALGGWHAAIGLDPLVDSRNASAERVTYVGVDDVDPWRARHWMVDASMPQVVVHVIDQAIADRVRTEVLPRRVVAVDLAEAGGPRCIEAALRIWR